MLHANTLRKAPLIVTAGSEGAKAIAHLTEMVAHGTTAEAIEVLARSTIAKWQRDLSGMEFLLRERMETVTRELVAGFDAAYEAVQSELGVGMEEDVATLRALEPWAALRDEFVLALERMEGRSAA